LRLVNEPDLNCIPRIDTTLPMRTTSGIRLRRPDSSLFSWHDAALELAADAFRGRPVLDVASGDGRLTCELAHRGAAEVIGIDISETALRIARQRPRRLTPRISFQVGDIEAIPMPDEQFPVVFCCETIEHVWNRARALSELRRTGGMLILTTPNYLSLAGLHRLSLRARGRRYSEGGQPVNNLTMWPRTALWLRRAGFRIAASGRMACSSRGRVPSRKRALRAPIAWLLWPLGHESAIKATRLG
jgi:SAM-dependent methyltransferase